MRLHAFLQTMYLPSRVEVSRGYAENLHICAKKFSAHLGRDAMLSDLTEQTICDYLSAYRKQWSARSTNNQRTSLVTFALAAWDYGLIPAPLRTRRIRKLKVHSEPPVAWTVDEMRQLLYTVMAAPGNVGDIPAGAWWKALVLTIYWTGCRVMAVLGAESRCYRPGHGITIVAQKNKRPQWYPLPRSCMACIDALAPMMREHVFPWPKYPKKIYEDFRKLVDASGLDAPKGRLNLFHKIRRTNISYCAAADPAIAQRQAGHADYRTTMSSYVDPTIAGFCSAADVLQDPLYESDTPRFRIYG